jgi:hypothetical protein
MKLTDKECEQLQGDELARWTDPSTGREFVLVPAEHYEKLKAVIDGLTRRAGWDDPALDVYEQYRKPK